MTCIHYSEHVRSYRDGESWTDPSTAVYGEEPAHSLLRIAVDVASLKAESRVIFDQESAQFDVSELVGLMSHIHEVDCRLLDWQHHLPDSWQSYRVLIHGDEGDRPQRKTWDGYVYVHGSIWVSAHVTTFHVLRLHVNALRLRVLRKFGFLDQSFRSTVQCLQQIADMICACVAPAVREVALDSSIPSGLKAEDISGRAVVSLLIELSPKHTRILIVTDESNSTLRCGF